MLDTFAHYAQHAQAMSLLVVPLSKQPDRAAAKQDMHMVCGLKVYLQQFCWSSLPCHEDMSPACTCLRPGPGWLIGPELSNVFLPWQQTDTVYAVSFCHFSAWVRIFGVFLGPGDSLLTQQASR